MSGERAPGITEIAACAHAMHVNIVVEKFDSQVLLASFGELTFKSTVMLALYKVDDELKCVCLKVQKR
jgi:hypothetical protein